MNLWECTQPISAITIGPYFRVLPKKVVQIEFWHELETIEGGNLRTIIEFANVYAFKCIFYPASLDIKYSAAYGKLISIEPEEWSKKIIEQNTIFNKNIVRHMMFTFDDGPVYEIIADNYTVQCEPVK